MLGFVLDCAHQNAFHLGRECRIDLTRPRILGEVENEQWIILWVSSGDQMKHGCAEAVNVNSRVRFSTEQFWRRVAHRAHGSDPFFLLVYPARNTKINQHDSIGVAVDHDVCRFQVTINDRLRSRVQVMQDVRNLNSPIGHGWLIDSSAGGCPQTRS